MPAANQISFAFLTRRADWCDDPLGLLESIRAETEAIRRGQLSLYFTGGLASVQRAGLLPRVLNSPMCFATAILTNLGHPLRHFTTRFPRTAEGLVAGNLIFEGIVGVPPARPQTHAAFALANNFDKLSISLKWDPHHLTSGDARQLLDHYLDQLRATAEGTAMPHSVLSAQRVT